MKTIIAGSRSITNISLVEQAIKESGFKITEVVSGTARGVDFLGELWAIKNKIPIKRFPADWGHYGKAAGHKRNEQMAVYAEACIIIWDGVSRGSLNMIKNAEIVGLKLFIKDISKKDNYLDKSIVQQVIRLQQTLAETEQEILKRQFSK